MLNFNLDSSLQLTPSKSSLLPSYRWPARQWYQPTEWTVRTPFPIPLLPTVANTEGRATALVVRLATSTHLLNVIPNPTFVPPTLEHPVTTLRVGELSVTDTEGRRHVDVELDPSTWSRAAVVDEGGGVWLWWEDKERVDGRTQKIMRL